MMRIRSSEAYNTEERFIQNSIERNNVQCCNEQGELRAMATDFGKK